jgi:hypothetical protein
MFTNYSASEVYNERNTGYEVGRHHTMTVFNYFFGLCQMQRLRYDVS